MNAGKRATFCVGQGYPRHVSGLSLRPSWPPLTRTWLRCVSADGLRGGILPALASYAGSTAGVTPPGFPSQDKLD
jgi:hypothetical protein